MLKKFAVCAAVMASLYTASALAAPTLRVGSETTFPPFEFVDVKTKQFVGYEIDLINAMKYDCVTLGNHEFDNGVDELARRLAKIKCPVVCANYDFSKVSLSQYVKPYTILKKAGMRIGIIGLMPDITILVSKEVSDMIPGFENSEVVNKWAEYLKTEKKCDLVIALTHIGFENEPYLDQMLVRRTRNVDLVVGGHSHTYLKAPHYENNLDGVPVPIVQDGEWGLYVGNMKISR